MSKKLSLLDLAFFIAESEASPKHVAGLLIFERPPKGGAGYAKKLYQDLLAATDVQPPFNRVINFSLSGWPCWEEVDEVDLSQHIFYHKLKPKQNSRSDLYQFVSQLHTPMLDRSRPLWEAHVIDGLPDGRFALYQKMHHACADGITMARWTAECLQEQADAEHFVPVWTLQYNKRSSDKRRAQNQQILQNMMSGAKGFGLQMLGIGRLATMLLLEAVNLTKNAIALPFVANGHTPLTGQVTRGRQFATVSVPMERINHVRNLTRSTLNHVALTCLDGALHRYLQDQGVKLEQPITIQMPVNLRQEGEKSLGNKIGIILVELSPPTDDPYVRLRNIGFSLRNVRTMVDSVAPAAIESYTIIMGLFGQIAEMLNMSDKAPPTGNTLVSNVPGPSKHLYMRDAKMLEMHPISTLPPSNLLNITLFSYAGQLAFGLIATDKLPNLERLAEYIDQSFTELESSVSAPLAPAREAPAKPKKTLKFFKE
ncbi:wax ester/triacylglycerol synthase family O-acyltransferase [Massilia sp. W12]|uniref:wax ester/triacylglycerol synthase family O-acyltransferase n=1 Tax=Massilia sp. W12 TaxID=3126507 RepID=UPI0030CADA2C